MPNLEESLSEPENDTNTTEPDPVSTIPKEKTDNQNTKLAYRFRLDLDVLFLGVHT